MMRMKGQIIVSALWDDENVNSLAITFEMLDENVSNEMSRNTL